MNAGDGPSNGLSSKLTLSSSGPGFGLSFVQAGENASHFYGPARVDGQGAGAARWLSQVAVDSQERLIVVDMAGVTIDDGASLPQRKMSNSE